MKKMQTFIKDFTSDESAQGATEYILLLVVVVALAMLFRDNIRGFLTTRLEGLGADLTGFTGQ